MTESEGLSHEFVEQFIVLYKTLSFLWRVARNTTFITKKIAHITGVSNIFKAKGHTSYCRMVSGPHVEK
jgi:hypothetical protein